MNTHTIIRRQSFDLFNAVVLLKRHCKTSQSCVNWKIYNQKMNKLVSFFLSFFFSLQEFLGKIHSLPVLFCFFLSGDQLASDAHFCRSLVIDQLKYQKANCSNPLQDHGLIKIKLWWSCVLLFFWCCRQACYYFPTKFKHSSVQKTDMLTSASEPQMHHDLTKVSGHVLCTVKVHYTFPL